MHVKSSTIPYYHWYFQDALKLVIPLLVRLVLQLLPGNTKIGNVLHFPAMSLADNVLDLIESAVC